MKGKERPNMKEKVDINKDAREIKNSRGDYYT